MEVRPSPMTRVLADKLFDARAARETFAYFDADGSGFIDAAELHSALDAYGIQVTKEGAQQVLEHYDSNPDGRLDESEFAEIVRDASRGVVVATCCSDSNSGTALEGCDVYPLDDLPVDADLVFDRLEAGGFVHCCTDLEPLLETILRDEAALRGRDGDGALAEWRRNGQVRCRRRYVA